MPDEQRRYDGSEEAAVPDDEATARAVVAALGLDGARLSPLGSGFGSDAWRVHTPTSSCALRIATDPADPPDIYRIEHALMTRLAADGAVVPSPVRGNWEIDGWRLAPFSLTSFMPGVPLQIDAHGWAAAQIAAFVGVLQAIPTTGFGPLEQLGGGFGGRFQDREAGLLGAFDGYQLWPLGDARIEAHPALIERPALAAAIAGEAAAIRTAALDGPGVIVHSDLHEANILQNGRRLGFIDFGECFVGAAGWELATIAYFGGWSLAERVLAALPSHGHDLSRQLVSIRALAICFALFRWEQDLRLGLNDPAHSEAFLRETLARFRERPESAQQ
jgi:Ser/Thr protein kinase RdoA (MazF antagonist)